MTKARVLGLWLFLPAAIGCNQPPTFNSSTASTTAVTSSFSQIWATTLSPKCVSCHSDQSPRAQISLQSYASTMNSAGLVVPYQPYQSELLIKTENGQMPPHAPPLSAAELQSIYLWISLGALQN